MSQPSMARAVSPVFATPRVKNDERREPFRFGDLSAYSWKQRLAIRAADLGFYSVINVLARTVRFHLEGEEHWHAAADGHLPIYTFWHDSIVLATYFFRHRDIVVMTSQSFDGEYIARFIQRFGYGSARGSSTRGGIGALVEMIRLAKQGYPTAFTIDGPKGPRQVAKMGAVLLAKKTGQPILPFTVTCSRCWNLNRSWDRMAIPKPFSHALLGFGEPIFVHRDADDAALEAKQAELQGVLDRLEARGQQWQAERNGVCR